MLTLRKPAWGQGGSIEERYMQARARNISNKIANPPTWEIIDEELQAELEEALGSEYYKNNVASVREAISEFRKTTGELPKDKIDRMKVLTLIATAFKGPAVELCRNLCSFMDASRYMNLAESYKKGKIKPELKAILNDTYKENPLGQEKGPLLPKMIKEKKINFESFKGKDDKWDDWQFDYRISFSPLPNASGGPAVTLEMAAKEAETNYILALTDLNNTVIRLLNGYKPSEELKKTMQGVPVDMDGYLIRPVAPETFLQFADAVEQQYQRRQKERTKKEYASPITSPYDAGFYINPETCTIYDLRPYTKDLNSLFSIKSWRYLKEFAAVIRDTVAEYIGVEQAKQKKEAPVPPSIFDKAFIKMFNASATNNIITINTSKSGRPESKNGYLVQNLFSQEWEFKKGGTELNIPIKHGENALMPIFTTSTWKVMHFLSLLFTAQNSAKKQDNIFPVVETSVREYMAATKRKITVNSVKDVTKALKKDLDILGKISIKYNDRKYSLSRVNPFAETHISRGKIKVALAPTFAEFLVKTTGLLMNYPVALLALTENNSNLFPLGYKLSLNRSNDANIRTGKANILSVPVCLEWCPGIPKIQDVRRMKNSPAIRIIEPFEKTLDALKEQGVLESWEYCLAKGEPLQDADVKDYNYFATLYIRYEINNFPLKDELPRIQATAEKRRKRIERIERFTDKAIAEKKAEELNK